MAPARDCTLQLIALDLDIEYEDDDDDDDEVFDCEIDPADVPGNMPFCQHVIGPNKKKQKRI